MYTQSLTLLMTLLCTSISGLTLKTPAVGYCDEDTVLECQVGHTFTAWTWYFGDSTKLFINGHLVNSYNLYKYTDTKMSNTAILTIHNTAPSDSGHYRCESGFDRTSEIELPVKCKASTAVTIVTNEKKVTFSLDKLYPKPTDLKISFQKERTTVTIVGTRRCVYSIQYSSYYDCEWSSNSSLADGTYMYNITITTIPPADSLTGLFKIVSPQHPVISNTVQLNDSRMVVYGNESQPLTIHCTSTGGYPTPTVAWYKDSVFSSNLLASTSTGSLQSDGTYTVTLQHTLTPTLTDDKKTLICRSYYPHADTAYIGSQTNSVMIHLSLKPNKPSVTQVSDVTAGGTMEVRCTTTGSRPAAIITWSYQGSTYTGTVTSTFNKVTETYTVVSVYRRRVTAVDNGRNIQCVVTHPALVSPSQRTTLVNLNVQFSVQASSTRITGNRVMIATGTATLTLTCTTGSSNPASDITWKNGSDIITNNRSYTNITGENNGMVRSQQLVLTPKRYMDGDVIRCSVSNSVSPSPVTDTATLDLRYSPFIDTLPLHLTTEGRSEQIVCKVDSKPISTITLYHGNTQLSKETLDNNELSYSLSPVNRTHYGIYRCKANNGINPEVEKNVTLSVRFKPVTTKLTGNSNIIANGQNALSLVCTSGSSNPVSDITWRINDTITQSTSNMSDLSGQYGGMKSQRGLTLRPTRDNDGDIVSCEAKNGIGTSERSVLTLNLKYRPLIDPMQNQVTVEGNVTVLPCKASSNPASTFRWYRQGQSDLILEGTGTLHKNQLPYTINNTRRTHAGIYICEADNKIEMVAKRNVSITVNYPPDVSALTKNTTVQAKSVLLKCNASGVPNSQYKYGQWKQKWPGTDVTVKEYSGSPSLVLDSLTYEHSGVYSCSASNGVKVFGTKIEYIDGSVQLLVKSYPVILNVNEKIYGRLKENVTVQIDYYSNVEQSTVKCHKITNGLRQSAFVIAERYDEIKVNLPVFSRNIITDGIRAFVAVRMNSKEDFGFYDLVVTNNIDAIFRTVEIIPGGPPSPPNNFQLLPVGKTPIFIWEESYDGGKAEKFIIQTSHSGTEQWINHTNETDLQYKMNDLFYIAEIKLQPGTYMARILSSNAIGDSEAMNLGYTFEIKEDQKPSSLENSCSCTAVGSSLGVICVIMAIYAGTVTFIWRRSLSVKGAQTLEEKVDQKMTYVNLTFKSGSTGADALQQKYSEETQYTSLERESRDDKATYDVLHAK